MSSEGKTYYAHVQESVQISKEEYARLKADSKFLHELYARGVDNWEGYHADTDEEEEDYDG